MPSVSYVYNADIYPFSAIVSIDVTFADGTHSRGTGAVVGVNDVLTASHVVDNDPVHGAVKSITVTPGVSGQASIYSEYSASHRAFRNIDPDGDGAGSAAEVRQDYAILTVDGPTPIGEATGYFGIRSNYAQDGDSVGLNLAGYPAGYQNGGHPDMVLAYGSETLGNGVWQHNYQDETNTEWAGASGSPFYVIDGNARYVVGVFSTSGMGTFIDTDVFDELQRWMTQNDEQRLIGNAKANRIEGGFRDDVLIGKGGQDRLFGHDGNDKLRGGKGDDTLKGGRGADILDGARGDDKLVGQKGHDKLIGGQGRDVLIGGSNGDTLLGGKARDKLVGGKGQDDLNGGGGNDNLIGGSGADRFIFTGKAGDDRIKGFEQGKDMIVIATGADGMADMKIRKSGSDVTITFDDSELTIQNSRPGQFQASDFDFI